MLSLWRIDFHLNGIRQNSTRQESKQQYNQLNVNKRNDIQ
jgi:hypothetical protein